MEHKKKKNGADRSDRNIFIGIGILCLIGLFVLVLFYQASRACACKEVNYLIPTLSAQTKIAATERFNATSTAIWTSIVSTSLAATERVNLTLTAVEKDTSSSTKPKAVTTEQFMLTSTARP